jgi:hypothetical protein
MSNIAEYALIFQTTTSDEWVEKRISAIADIKRWLEAMSRTDVITCASAIATSIGANQALPPVYGIAVENIIREHAKSFVRSENSGELEITVLVSAAAEDLIEEALSDNGWKTVDALAAALWSALGAQQSLSVPKLEKLRQNLMSASRSRVLETGERSRTRRPIPPIGSVNINQDSSAGSRVNQAFSRAVEPMVNAMQENAALDREELDFLWWLMSDRSEILDEPMASLNNTVRAVTAGLESAAKLRKLPAEAHRNIVLRNVEEGEPLSIVELLEVAGAHRQKWSKSLGTILDGAPAVFPLFAAIVGEEDKGILSAVKLSPYEWGQRALLEGAIHHIHAHTNGGL